MSIQQKCEDIAKDTNHLWQRLAGKPASPNTTVAKMEEGLTDSLIPTIAGMTAHMRKHQRVDAMSMHCYADVVTNLQSYLRTPDVVGFLSKASSTLENLKRRTGFLTTAEDDHLFQNHE